MTAPVTITKATPGGDNGTWGTKINTALDTLTAGVNRKAERGDPGHARGQVVLMLDDVKASHYAALPTIEAVGGRVTLAVNSNAIGGGSNMNSTQVLDAFNRGHEIACHSKTHTDMTSLSAAGRVTEWDDSKTALEAIIGAGNVTSWIYPGNTANLTTDVEAYCRYDRVFGSQIVTSQPIGDRWDQFSHGRIAWQGDTSDSGYNHPDVLARLRQAAVRDEVVVIYTHNVDGTGIPSATASVTSAQLTEFVTLVNALGMQMVTAREAFPGHRPVMNANADDGLNGWELFGTGSAGITVSAATDTPPAGIPGTKSFAIAATSSGIGGLRMKDYYQLRRPSEPHTVTLRLRHDRTSGAGSSIVTVYEYDQYGALVTSTDSALYSTATQAWTQVAIAITPAATTRAIRVAVQNGKTGSFTGTTYFKHVHIGPTRLGVLG